MHNFIQQSLNSGSAQVQILRDGEDLWQWSWLEISLNAFRWSTIPQKQFIIIIPPSSVHVANSEQCHCWLGSLNLFICKDQGLVQRQAPDVFCKKDFLKFFSNFTGKQLCWSLFLIKLQAYIFIKKDSGRRRCFSVKFTKYLRTPVLKNICERLLLLVKMTVFMS